MLAPAAAEHMPADKIVEAGKIRRSIGSIPGIEADGRGDIAAGIEHKIPLVQVQSEGMVDRHEVTFPVRCALTSRPNVRS